MGPACDAASSASDGAAAAAADGASAAPAATHTMPQVASESDDDDADADVPFNPLKARRRDPALSVAAKEVPSPASGGASAGGDAASAGATVPGAVPAGEPELDSDDEPLCGPNGWQNSHGRPDGRPENKRKGKEKKRGKDRANLAKRRGPAACDGSESEEDEAAILRGKGPVWTYAFVLAFHNHFYDEAAEDNCPWKLSKAVIDPGTKAISVTRTALKMPRHLTEDPGITFEVEQDDEKHFNIMFDNYAGGMMVSVTGICKKLPGHPKAKEWSNTVRFRRVYTSSEALNRTDSKLDKIK